MDVDSTDNEDDVAEASENIDELKEEMDKIKVRCLATHIMEITRLLSDERKQKLQAYCDKVMLS